jgi:hypothetical protein
VTEDKVEELDQSDKGKEKYWDCTNGTWKHEIVSKDQNYKSWL